jgi:hypothetical protein
MEEVSETSTLDKRGSISKRHAEKNAPQTSYENGFLKSETARMHIGGNWQARFESDGAKSSNILAEFKVIGRNAIFLHLFLRLRHTVFLSLP